MDLNFPLELTQPELPSSSRPILIAIAGGACSSKAGVAKALQEHLESPTGGLRKEIHTIALSNFYRPGLSEASNFDHPDALDWDSLHSFIDSLSSGDSACHPVFSHKSHSRVGSSPRINPDLVIFHGQFLLYDKQVRDKMHLKIFVDVDGDDRLATRLTRYTSRYQEKVDEILSQYVRRVKPCFENFVSPTKRWADVILPRGLENTNGTRLIATHLEDILNKKDSFPPLTSAFCLEPDGEALSTDDEGLEEVMK